MKKFLLILLAIFSLTACHVDEPDTPPALKLQVVYADGQPYPYASVDLYDSRHNFENRTNPVVTGETDEYGEIVFVDLYDVVYFFEVYDDEYRYDNCYEGGLYSTRNPLMYNDMRREVVQLLPYR